MSIENHKLFSRFLQKSVKIFGKFYSLSYLCSSFKWELLRVTNEYFR
jgi:hypothetical protein